MRKFVLLSILFSFMASGLYSQCESCSAPDGVTIQHCYQDVDQPGKCAMFMDDKPTFYFEDKNRKKKRVVEVTLPSQLAAPGIPYLAQLGGNSDLRLTGSDMLFLRDAINNWRFVEAIRNWNPEVLKEGYAIRESGLAYRIITQGQGDLPQAGQKVKVHYTGYFTDGKKFDSSLDRQAPFVFPLGKGQVIKGWDEGVALMRPGSRFLFRIPGDLAYGERGFPGAIPPNATLFFDVKFLSVE